MYGLGLFFLLMAIVGGLFWHPWRWRRPIRRPLWQRPGRPVHPISMRRPMRRRW